MRPPWQPERHLREPLIGFVGSLAALGVLVSSLGAASTSDESRTPVPPASETLTIANGEHRTVSLGATKAGETYRLLVSVETVLLSIEERLEVELVGSHSETLRKALHAGDSDLYLPYRPLSDGAVTLKLARSRGAGSAPWNIRVEWAHLPLAASEKAAIEAEPNDFWQDANALQLGRDVYGSADEVDYLQNRNEGKAGLDWFRFEVAETKPILVYFQLDLLDRDVSANLRVYTVDPKRGQPEPYLQGKDPMEIVHDRERERYSKHISRTFSRGTYYLEVNSNHPDYILRTRVLPVPPYSEPTQAVEAGMHYIINVGDAWFAQIPREGNVFVRSDNLHDTATRCTACHPSSFSTEANLAAQWNGYPIRSKSSFQYVIDRIYNSMAPLYGNGGMYYQRFIAIPRQAQGKQGSILLDFERQISGRRTKTVERFGPFLRSAWESRTDLPEDEANGVVPLDSKFGFAWRDWRVLDELAQRNRDAGYRKAADSIAAIVGDRAADRRIETLQDRIHRLYAWWLLDKSKFASKIKRETGALLSLQNSDGGWHEVDTGPGPSAVYTTGQLTWTLLRIGQPRDHPAIQKALRYLLAQQQEFGGWIQTATHENFRTPMRETRYAVMALAEAFPHAEAPQRGWGNRDLRPARLPRRDGLVELLDDLENLWDVAEPDRARFAQAVIALLDHPEPAVRAAAASCLGRLGAADSVAPLSKRLGDPSKIVWRAAAWALRRLGNDGLGQDAILAALKSSSPATRRGATRILAYQFYGMDERLELAEPLFELCRDRDLWTRLQAQRTLRQWFYRTSDPKFARRIVEVYLARMSEPDAPVIRKNLSEGLYVMLDENLGGGVSLQKNIAPLPEAMRPGILEARRAFERDVLLTPIFWALEHGNDLQRAGVLKAFDGSFFKGRSYARQPPGAIDVGNDREFGFLYEPDVQSLESAFEPLLRAELPPEPRRQAIQLAGFFQLPGQTRNAAIQRAILRRLSDPDSLVREAARSVVGHDLSLAGAEGDPERMELIAAAMEGSAAELTAILQAVGRNERLAGRPELMAAIRRVMNRDDAAPALLPVARWSAFKDVEVLAIVLHAWQRLSTPERARAIAALLARPALVDTAEPREQVIQVLRRGMTDPSAEVRDKTLRGINSLPALWGGKGSAALLVAALADDAPALRKLGLTLGSTKPGFWRRADARDYLKRLLVDPDAEVRLAALATVEHQALLQADPTFARWIKALDADPELAGRARMLLSSANLDPRAVPADVALGRPRLLSLSTFRRTVNPLFYQASEDGYACARCHANHTILRIAEFDSRISQAEALLTNYNSALKVVNLGEPESSLLLRKPRSPQGQGGADPSSRTGLTHVGGPRWESDESPAYRAILDWIREASRAAAAGASGERFSADSHSPGYEPALAGDGDPRTRWQTEFVGATPGYPHELVVDLGGTRSIEGLLYVPPQDSSSGRVGAFEIRVSQDGKTWGEPLARGRWENDPTYKYAALPSPRARYVQLRGLSEVEGRPFMSAAEVAVETRP
jgi:HEAT repeat protein